MNGDTSICPDMHIDICLTRRFGRREGTREIDYKLVQCPQTEERKDYGTDSCVLQNSARNTRNEGGAITN